MDNGGQSVSLDFHHLQQLWHATSSALVVLMAMPLLQSMFTMKSGQSMYVDGKQKFPQKLLAKNLYVHAPKVLAAD